MKKQNNLDPTEKIIRCWNGGYILIITSNKNKKFIQKKFQSKFIIEVEIDTKVL